MSAAFPAATWDRWPGTRVGALLYNAIVLVFIAVVWFFHRKEKRWAGAVVRYIRPHRRGCPHSVVHPCLLGFVLGLFLHFIPCIFWTCDWSEDDGEGFRGAVWFSVWGVTWVVLTVWNHFAEDSAGDEKKLLSSSNSEKEGGEGDVDGNDGDDSSAASSVSSESAEV
jgi:hypothetical protein